MLWLLNPALIGAPPSQEGFRQGNRCQKMSRFFNVCVYEHRENMPYHWKKNRGKPTTTQPASTPLNTNRKIDPKDTCFPLILCGVWTLAEQGSRQGKPCHCVFCQIGLHRLGSGPSSCSVVWCTSCCMMLYIVCMGSFLVLLKNNVATANSLQFCTKNVSPGWKTQ